MPRYEFVEGNSNKFWEITLEGSSFTTRWGKIGTDGQEKTQDWPDAATAKKEYEKIISSKTKKGYELVEGGDDDEGGDEGDGDESASASNPAMEAAILKNPDDKAAWLVYGDWLQSQGDVRGELTALYAKDPAAASELVDKHAEELFGEELAEVFSEGTELHEVKWKYGFIDAASLKRADYDSDTDLAELTAKFLARPVTRFIRSLTFGLASFESDNDWTETIDAVAKARGDVVQALYFSDFSSEDCEISWTAYGDFSNALKKLPALRTLHIKSGEGGNLGEVNLPELRTFIRESGGLGAEEVKEIATARWPKLERLEIWFGQDNYGAGGTVEAIQSILDAKGLPALRHLGLKNCEFTEELIPALAKSKVLGQLTSLDLSKSTLGPEGAQTLISQADAFRHLKQLDLQENFLGEDEVRRILAAFPGAMVADQREDEGPEDRYAAVGE